MKGANNATTNTKYEDKRRKETPAASTRPYEIKKCWSKYRHHEPTETALASASNADEKKMLHAVTSTGVTNKQIPLRQVQALQMSRKCCSKYERHKEKESASTSTS